MVNFWEKSSEDNSIAKIADQEKVIARLEKQLSRLKDNSSTEKQELRNTALKLYKTEKELSDAKIDIRISKREAKTFEEQVVKLKEELKLLMEKMEKAQESKEQELAAEIKKVEELRSELADKQEKIIQLKITCADFTKVSEEKKQLQTEYNSLRQNLLTSEKDLSAARAQLDILQANVQSLTSEKVTLAAKVDELQTKVKNLELNNTVLRETGQMLDEQLEDYERFVTEQSASLKGFKENNTMLKQNISILEEDLVGVRNALSEERASRCKAEGLVASLRTELSAKIEVVDELRAQLDFAHGSSDAMTSRLQQKESLVKELENELNERDADIQQLHSEIIWLKEEISAKLSDAYILKEENCRLNQELEDSGRFAEALQDRIGELEQVISELEAFHRQREMKDEATKQQQNKLITFLQTKIQEEKKKKTLADKLFGARRRDPPSPRTPAVTPSPRGPSEVLRKKVVSSPRTESPRTQNAMAQLVNSPTSRIAKPRMHHKIPHRFKIQTTSLTAKCAACHSSISRGAKASVCVHCAAVAHPNCAATAPKTCGLPQEFAKHFVQTVETPDVQVDMNGRESSETKGWVDLMMPGESSWHRRYLIIEGQKVLIYETDASRADSPAVCWEIVKGSGKTMVADDVTADELPGVAKQDLPFVFKVVYIPQTTCWPAETYYLLFRNSADKLRWISSIQNIVDTFSSGSVSEHAIKSSESKQELTVVFHDTTSLTVNCFQDLEDGISIMGTSKGLYALRTSTNTTPTHINGVCGIDSMVLAPQLNQTLIVTSSGILLSTDYRMLVSNAKAAACSEPGIKTDNVPLDSSDAVTVVAVSQPAENGIIYLAVATAQHLMILRWCGISNKYTTLKNLATPHSVACATFIGNSLIVGSQSFQRISLHDFSVQEVITTRKGFRQSLLKLQSYPMFVTQVNAKETLLCFREFGIFVDEKGDKSRSDLKWAHLPKEFTYLEPFLFAVCIESVEIIHVSSRAESYSDGGEDTMSIATTATINDSTSIPVSAPLLLGVNNKRGIYVRSGDRVISIEGKGFVGDDNEIETGLSRCGDTVGRFSFTSSLVDSLEDETEEEDELRHDKTIQHTEL